MEFHGIACYGIVLLVLSATLSATLESENGLLVTELQSIENEQFCQKSRE